MGLSESESQEEKIDETEIKKEEKRSKKSKKSAVKRDGDNKSERINNSKTREGVEIEK